MRFKTLLSKYWPLLSIIFVEIILFIANYVPGTYLIGWDNLYPELNFGLNIKRSFFSVWQHYRSLGYVDGMSHAANLFHDIFRFMLSLFMPQNLVRWAFIFFMHLIGGIGMFVILKNYVLHYFTSHNFHEHHETKHSHDLTPTFIALFGAFFYQYNLITVQQFFLPFELFLVHFAFLPWLVYFCLQFLRDGKKKHLIHFALFSFLSIPQAHVPTIFIVYIMALAFILLTQLITSRGKAFKRIILITLVTILVNSFWGIPFAYATAKGANTIANSKNNQMATDDIYYRNLKFGDFQSVALMKGVVIDYWQYDIKSQTSHYMMHPWLDHIETGSFRFPAWAFFSLAVFGLMMSFIKRKKEIWPLIILFFFSLSMMANDTPVISLVYEFLRVHVPLFHNIFRFTFTKFAFLYAFSVTIFLALGVHYLLDLFRNMGGSNGGPPKSSGNFGIFGGGRDRTHISYVMNAIMLLVLFTMLFFYTFPSFQKHFFYENLAAEMPKAYFQTFDFFSKQNKNERVAMLPIPWYWSWTQNDWNTIGSGFTWYGIPQPTGDRAFDPWSDKNENFYWELDQAIYSEDITQLEAVLDKYDTSWIFFDRSVHNGSASKFDFSRYTNLIESSQRFQLAQQYDFIDIYRFDKRNQSENFVSLKNSAATVSPTYRNDNFDEAYQRLGDYVTKVGANDGVFYPLRSLFSGKRASDEEFVVKDYGDKLAFEVQLDASMAGKRLHLPNPYLEEFKVLNLSDPSISSTVSAELRLDGETLFESADMSKSRTESVTIPAFTDGLLQIIFKKTDLKLYDSKDDYTFTGKYNDGCWTNMDGLATVEPMNRGVEFTSLSSNNCINLDFLNMPQRYGYLINLHTVNSPVKGLFFSAINSMTKKSDLETYLDHDGKEHQYYFILSPRNQYGLGYTLNFNNVSFGREEVVNTLKQVSVYQIPFYFLKGITIGEAESSGNYLAGTEGLLAKAEEHNYFIYTVSVNKEDIEDNSTIYLSQAYDNGWKAYEVKDDGFMNKYIPFISGKEVKDHVMVNNWANGWRIGQNTESARYTLIFWPQYLMFAGMLMTLSAVGVIYFYKERRN